jgi:hypothetical protein
MSSHKHSHSAPDLAQPYEKNEIQLKGVVGFAIGLVALIVITFGLMWALINVLKDFTKEPDSEKNPMAMSDREKLPPEPRLQAAPGFHVDSERGPVNLELMAPQAEYRELRKEWEVLWEHGQKDAKTGIVTMMPVDEAKEKFLDQHVKAKSGADVDAFYAGSQSYISDSSAGRLASEKRR